MCASRLWIQCDQRTLPDRELSSGIAEIIKYGLIRDPELFEWLEEHVEEIVARDPAALAFAIKRSCENKVRCTLGQAAVDERGRGQHVLAYT